MERYLYHFIVYLVLIWRFIVFYEIQAIQYDTINTYSHKGLNMSAIDYDEFNSLLEKMKNHLESNILRLESEYREILNNDEVNDMEDRASLESENMHHDALITQQKHELEEVNHALEKIKNGTYGICEASGDIISIQRLRAEPHTRYCIEHATKG